MKAAVVLEMGQAPVYRDFRDPEAQSGHSVVRVTAAAISHLTKGRAYGTHYSASGAFPFVPGVDGVGIDDSGRRIYFVLPEHPFGAMAEQCLVDQRRLIALPDTLRDDVAAAIAIPGMSSWAALVERAHLVRGETVLINGATGTSGRLAIQIARHLGAKKVIATGRRIKTFPELRRLGADVTISLLQDDPALQKAFNQEFRAGVDVVLDYIWGASAEKLIVAAASEGPDGVPIRYIEIGSLGGASVNVPGAALRASALQLMGSGMGSVPLPQLVKALRGVFDAAPAAGFEVVTKSMPLSEVTNAWADGSSEARIVLHP